MTNETVGHASAIMAAKDFYQKHKNVTMIKYAPLALIHEAVFQ